MTLHNFSSDRLVQKSECNAPTLGTEAVCSLQHHECYHMAKRSGPIGLDTNHFCKSTPLQD